jgi:hypothetical protein
MKLVVAVSLCLLTSASGAKANIRKNGRHVSALGLGCMGMGLWPRPSRRQAEHDLRHPSALLDVQRLRDVPGEQDAKASANAPDPLPHGHG